MTNKRENKKIQKENEQQGELSCPLVERQKTFVRTPSHIARARERERERTGEENTRSPFRIIIIIIIIIIQHHQTLRRSFVEWWCFSA